MPHIRKRITALAVLFILLIPPRASTAQVDLIIEQTQIAGRIEETVTPLTPLTTVPPDADAKAWPTEAVAAPASIESTVPLFEAPDEDSAVLMEYYSGARLTALRPEGGGFWRVQAGEKGAGIIGFMRADDLRFGRQAQREVQPAYMELRFNREATVYAYCDTGSAPIGVCDTEHTYYAMSRTDGKWVQLFLPPVDHIREQEDRVTAGFVYMETGLGRGYWHELERWTVDPLPGERSHEAIRLMAIEALVEDMESADRRNFWNTMPTVFTSRAGLEGLHCRVQQRYGKVGGALETQADWYYVYFWLDELNGTIAYWTEPDLDDPARWESIDYIRRDYEPGYHYVFEL